MASTVEAVETPKDIEVTLTWQEVALINHFADEVITSNRFAKTTKTVAENLKKKLQND